MLWCSRKLVTPLKCALTKNAPANPLESALTNSLHLKPFGMNRCKKGGGRGARLTWCHPARSEHNQPSSTAERQLSALHFFSSVESAGSAGLSPEAAHGRIWSRVAAGSLYHFMFRLGLTDGYRKHLFCRSGGFASASISRAARPPRGGTFIGGNAC